MTDELLRPKDVERLYGVKESTQENWRKTGRGPVPIPFTSRYIAYRKSDWDAWIQSLQDAAANERAAS